MPRPRPLRGSLRLRIAAGFAAVALVLGFAWYARSSRRPPPVDAGLPPGAVLSGRGPALAELARCLGRWAESPAAGLASAVASRAAACELFSATAASPAEWGGVAGCTTEDPLAALRGDADVAFAIPAGETTRAVGRIRVAAGGAIEAEVRFDLPGEPSVAAAWAPAVDPPGDPVLADALAVVHARVRAHGGLDPAALAPRDASAAQMFRLGGSVLSGALLDGTWELALYAPPPGDPVPRPVLAVGVRSAAAAQAAMGHFLADVEAQWDVRRVPYAFQGNAGACLPGLQLLPTLAPCYVGTADALVLAWDQASLEHAIRAGGVRSLASDAALDLDVLRGADVVVRAAMGHAQAVAPYPWGRVAVDLAREENHLVVRASSARGCGA